MSIEFWLGLMAAVIDIVLARYLFLHKPRTRAKTSFGIMILMLAVWITIHLIGLLQLSADTYVMLVRLSLLSMLYVPSLYLYFIYTFPDKKLSMHKGLLIFIPPTLILPFIFTNYNAGGFFDPNVVAYSNVRVGSVYHFFIPLTVLHLFSAMIILVQKIVNSQGVKRMQLIYILIGTVVPYVLILVINAILPAWYGIVSAPIYGVVFSLIFSVSVTYAITRYRFFGVRFILTRTLFYILFFIAGYSGVVLLFLLLRDQQSVYIVAFILTVALFSIHHLMRYIRKKITKVVPLEGYDFSVIDEAPKVLDTISNFDALAKDTQKVLTEEDDTIASTQLFVFLRPDDRWIRFPQSQKKKLLSDHVLSKAVHLKKDVILLQEVEMDEVYTEDEDLRTELLATFEQFNAQAIMPLWWFEEEIRGLLLVTLKDPEHFISAEQFKQWQSLSKGFGRWLTGTIAHHYAVLRAERMNVGLDPNRD